MRIERSSVGLTNSELLRDTTIDALMIDESLSLSNTLEESPFTITSSPKYLFLVRVFRSHMSRSNLVLIQSRYDLATEPEKCECLELSILFYLSYDHL